MNVTLEYLQHDDLQEYKLLLDAVLGETVGLEVMQARYQTDHPYVKTVVAKLLCEKPTQCFETKKGSEMIGSITFVLIDTFTGGNDPRIEFSNFAVTPAARGTDTAKMLMEFVTDYARDFGYNSVTVNCGVNAARAHTFYEKMGFVRDDKARFVKVIDTSK